MTLKIPDDLCWRTHSYAVVRNAFDFDGAKLLQKSEMRKDIVIELSYKGFG